MKIPKPILERRRSIRIDQQLPFKVGAEGFELEATSLNISSTGVMGLLERDIPLMTKLSIAIPLHKTHFQTADSKNVLRVKGVVVRKEKDPSSERFQVAIFFSDLTESDRQTLSHFISSQIKP